MHQLDYSGNRKSDVERTGVPHSLLNIVEYHLLKAGRGAGDAVKADGQLRDVVNAARRGDRLPSEAGCTLYGGDARCGKPLA